MDGAAEMGAVIDAEGLVANGTARLHWHRSGFALQYRIAFSDDLGAPCRLELVQRFDGRTLCTCTELTGTLRGDGEAWGNACLRVDYRDLSLGAIWDAVRSLRRID
jgi:hypothetical protein